MERALVGWSCLSYFNESKTSNSKGVGEEGVGTAIDCRGSTFLVSQGGNSSLQSRIDPPFVVASKGSVIECDITKMSISIDGKDIVNGEMVFKAFPDVNTNQFRFVPTLSFKGDLRVTNIVLDF